MLINTFLHTTLASNTTGIVIGIVSGLVALIAVAVVLYFTVFKMYRLKRQVADLNSRYNTSHGLLFGDINTLIKRLETISNLNLVYINDYTEWSKRYKDIRDISDANISYRVKELKNLVQESRWNELKEKLPQTKGQVNDYTESVDKLFTELKERFRVEDECNELMNSLKAQLRQVKMIFNNNAADLNLVVGVFENVFKMLDTLIEQCETHVESARYGDAKTILEQKIEPAVNRIQEGLKVLPEICVQLTSVLPDNISSLQGRYDTLTAEGIPLNQICNQTTIQDLNDLVASLCAQTRTLVLTGIQDSINSIHETIDTALRKFDEECDAKEKFEEEIIPTNDLQRNVQKDFVRLNNGLDQIKAIYLIDENDSAKIKNIKDLIDKTAATKRNLDAFINSATKQPYTVLLQKVRTLNSETKKAKEALDAFMQYLISLRGEVQDAFQDQKEYFLKIRDAECIIEDIRIEAVTQKYADTFDNLYSLIDELNHLLHQKPADVKQIEARHQRIVTDGDMLIASVNKTLENMNESEKAIVIANRHRAPNPDIDATIKQSENFFFDGKFDEALSLVNAANQRIESGNSRR